MSPGNIVVLRVKVPSAHELKWEQKPKRGWKASRLPIDRMGRGQGAHREVGSEGPEAKTQSAVKARATDEPVCACQGHPTRLFNGEGEKESSSWRVRRACGRNGKEDNDADPGRPPVVPKYKGVHGRTARRALEGSRGAIRRKLKCSGDADGGVGWLNSSLSGERCQNSEGSLL